MANITNEERERRKKEAEAAGDKPVTQVAAGEPVEGTDAKGGKPTVEESQVKNPALQETPAPVGANAPDDRLTPEESEYALAENARLESELATVTQQRDAALVELDAIKDELQRRTVAAGVVDSNPQTIAATLADSAGRAGRFAVADVEDDDPLDPMPVQDPRLGTDTPGWQEWAQRRARRVATGGNR